MLRQPADQVGERRLENLMGGFLDLEPLRSALALLPPGLELLGHFERVDADPAEIEMRRAPLPVIVGAERLVLDFTLHAGLLLRLLGSRLVRLLTLHGPA